MGIKSTMETKTNGVRDENIGRENRENSATIDQTPRETFSNKAHAKANGTNFDNESLLTWDEVEKHKGKDSKWIVIENKVYDVTVWQKKHPGGARILGHFAGQDATEAWMAFHKNQDLVRRFLTPLCVGSVLPKTGNTQRQEIKKDFASLRQTAERLGLFKADPKFFVLYLGHAVLLEALGVAASLYFGTTWFSYLITIMFLVPCQAQLGWIQHDYGHHSVFQETKFNHAVQYLVMCFMKGGGAHWWNFRHFQHHAKSNVFRKDPDVTIPQLFLPGDQVPEKWGRQKRGIAPYQHQHHYFWLMGPTSLMTIYFHFEISYFMLKRRDYLDIFLVGLFGLKWLAEFYWTWGVIGSFVLYMTVRLFESFWFTFVTQMSHIPMEIAEESDWDWVTGNTITTTNVAPGAFNDWFTGHLNYQIEHHLFPTMPRHNFQYVAPLVESLCKKHGLPYTVKPLSMAFSDILRSLRKSGKIWYDAFYDR